MKINLMREAAKIYFMGHLISSEIRNNIFLEAVIFFKMLREENPQKKLGHIRLDKHVFDNNRRRTWLVFKYWNFIIEKRSKKCYNIVNYSQPGGALETKLYIFWPDVGEKWICNMWLPAPYGHRTHLPSTYLNWRDYLEAETGFKFWWCGSDVVAVFVVM